MSDSQSSQERPLRQRLVSGVSRTLALYPLIAIVIALIIFSKYFYFTTDDDIVFLNRTDCDVTLESVFSSDDISGDDLLVYTQTRFYLDLVTAELHNHLNTLYRDIENYDLSIVYIGGMCDTGLRGRRELHDYITYIHRNRLYGYHANVARTEIFRYLDQHRAGYSYLWFIPADRDTLHTGLEFYGLTYEEFKNVIMHYIE